METHGGDPELCALLDSALADFDHQGKKGKHDDDDLDAFMYEHDTSAQEHAASRFQELLNDGKESFEPANTFSNGNIMKVFTELLDKTDPAISDGEIETGEECKMFATLLQKFTGRPTEGQGATGDDDSTVDALMEWVIGAAVSKEMMYSSVCDLHHKYAAFLTEKRPNISDETRLCYTKQYEILGRLKAEYEYEEDEGETIERSKPSSSASTIKKPSSIRQNARATRIASHWLEMQQLGLPPPELTNTLPSASSGIDGLVGGETGTDAEACNIM